MVESGTTEKREWMGALRGLSLRFWFDNWLIDWRHFPELFRYVTTGYVQSYKSWIEEKFHSVLKGNMDLINEIFE